MRHRAGGEVPSAPQNLTTVAESDCSDGRYGVVTVASLRTLTLDATIHQQKTVIGEVP